MKIGMGFLVRAILAFSLFFSFDVPGAAPDAPVIRVDGAIADASPVTRGERADITMTTSFSGGSIFYTLDGSAPSGASTRYTGQFTITSTKTIRAIAYSVDFEQSAEADPVEVRIVPYVTLTLAHPAGSISANPPPTNGRYLQGTTVRLTAAGAAGWSFMHWEGDLSGSQNPADIVLDSNKSVRAVFGAPLNVIDPANGSIHTAPEILPGAIIRNYTDVTVTAVPDPGYYFQTWGGILSGSNPRTVFNHTVANGSISALFAPLPENKVTITATADHGGAAIVANYSRSGAQNYYDRDAVVVVYARAANLFAFTGWSGDATGLENPIFVRLDRSKHVHATFQRGVSLTVNTTDGGTVSRSLPGPLYTPGSQIQLTATPAAGQRFVGWIGAITGNANPATLTIETNSTVSARFAAAAWEPAWAYETLQDYVLPPVARDGAVFTAERRTAVALTSAGAIRWRTPATVQGEYWRTHRLSLDSLNQLRMSLNYYDFDDVYATFNTFTPLGAASSFPVQANRLVQSFAVGSSIYSVLSYDDGFRPSLGQYLAALRPTDGSAEWTFQVVNYVGGPRNETFTDSLTRPAISLEERLYFGASNTRTNALEALSRSGAEIWRRIIESGNLDPGGSGYGPGVRDFAGAEFRIGAEVVLGETVGYAIQGDGSLLAFDLADGMPRWTFRSGDVLQTPSIGADGALYFGSRNSGRVYALNADGSVRWVRSPGFGPYGVPAIGSDGTIYIGDSASLHALSADGDKLREFNIGIATSSPIIDGNKLYVSTPTRVFAFNVANGPARSHWPMADANAQRTGAAADLDPEPPVLEAPVIQVDGSTPTGSPVDRAGQAVISIVAAPFTAEVYYTVDGATPTTFSTPYTGPFTITATSTIRAIAYNADRS